MFRPSALVERPDMNRKGSRQRRPPAPDTRCSAPHMLTTRLTCTRIQARVISPPVGHLSTTFYAALVGGARPCRCRVARPCRRPGRRAALAARPQPCSVSRRLRTRSVTLCLWRRLFGLWRTRVDESSSRPWRTGRGRPGNWRRCCPSRGRASRDIFGFCAKRGWSRFARRRSGGSTASDSSRLPRWTRG
jgi:hypothetical protein